MSGFIFNCEKCSACYDIRANKKCPECYEESTSYVEYYSYQNKALDSGCVEEIVDSYQGFDCFEEFDDSDIELLLH